VSVCPSEFLAAAEVLLASDKQTEMDRRNAVSRSYYSAYHEALAVVAVLKWPDPNQHLGMGAHERLVEMIKSRSELSRSKVLGIMLNGLKLNRHKADYKLECTVGAAEVAAHLEATKKFIGEFRSLATVPANAIPPVTA